MTENDTETMTYEQAYQQLAYAIAREASYPELNARLARCVAALRAAQSVRHAVGDRVLRVTDGRTGTVTNVWDSSADPDSDAVTVTYDDGGEPTGGSHSAFRPLPARVTALARSTKVVTGSVDPNVGAVVVTNVSDLSRTMSHALVSAEPDASEDGDHRLVCRPATARALVRRGLASDTLRLTEAGERARLALLDQSDEPAEVSVECRTGLCTHEHHGYEPSAPTAAARAPHDDEFSSFWVRNLVERVGGELHTFDRIAAGPSETSWGEGHREGFLRAAEYLARTVRHSVERLGLTELFDAARAGVSVSALAEIPQRITNSEG